MDVLQDFSHRGAGMGYGFSYYIFGSNTARTPTDAQVGTSRRETVMIGDSQHCWGGGENLAFVMAMSSGWHPRPQGQLELPQKPGVN